MKRLLYLFVSILIVANIHSLRASNPNRDDISIFAASMIDSLRMHPIEIFEMDRPLCWSDSMNEYLNILDFPSEQNYLDEEDEIPRGSISAFEKDFYLRYVLFDLLLPPYFKVNNPKDTLPVYSTLRIMEGDKISYIDSITGVEIGILPQMYGNTLKLELFVQQVYWDRIENCYTRPMVYWIADDTMFAEDYLKKIWFYRYHDGLGWKRTFNIALDSVADNDIVRLCVESAKLSANVINEEKNVYKMYIDHRYILQYTQSAEGPRVLSDPDYHIDSNEYDLEYIVFAYDPSVPNIMEEKFLEDIKSGSYFLRPKYRLDGDKFYVDVEIYFVCFDENYNIKYDLIRTDTYTYQLNTDNQWQLLN